MTSNLKKNILDFSLKYIYLIFPSKSVRVFVVKVVWIKVDVAVEAIDLGAVQVQFVSAEGRRLSRAAASDFVLVTF